MKEKKCDKVCKSKGHNCACKESLDHLNRIEGQIRTLKKYIEEGKRCEEVALLSTSIAKSFDTLRTRTLRNFFINEVLYGKKLSKKDEERIDKILKLYKK